MDDKAEREDIENGASKHADEHEQSDVYVEQSEKIREGRNDEPTNIKAEGEVIENEASGHADEHEQSGGDADQTEEVRGDRGDEPTNTRAEGEVTGNEASGHIDECLEPCPSASEPEAISGCIRSLSKSKYRLSRGTRPKSPKHLGMLKIPQVHDRVDEAAGLC